MSLFSTHHRRTRNVSPSVAGTRPARRSRVLAGVACGLALGAVAVSPAAASSANANKGGCPSGSSPWRLTDAAQWRAISAAGLVSEFGSEAAAAAAFEEPSFAALLDLVDEVFVDFVDLNGDGLACVSTTNPPGQPDYAFNVLDNKFNAKHAG